MLLNRLNGKFRRRLPEVVGAALAIVMVGIALPASAHYVYAQDTVFIASSECVEVRSEVSHGSHNGGFYKTKVEVWKEFLGYGNCIYHWERSAGKIAAKQEHWAFVNNNWFACTATGWIFNSSTGNQLDVAVNHPNRNPACGAGTYANWTGGYNNNGGTWNGGWVWSGGHVLPA